MKLSKEQKLNEIDEQIDVLINQFSEMCKEAARKVITTEIAEDIFLEDNFLLAKAVVDSKMRMRPFDSLGYKAEFENLHIIL